MEIYSILDLDVGYYWRTAAARIFVHENYHETQRGLYNDIALYKTATSASFNCEDILNFVHLSPKF